MVKISCCFFSPTGKSERVATAVALGMDASAQLFDISVPPYESRVFSQNDVVVFACPVYGGRIPEPTVKALQAIQGKGAKAVTLVTYGNRAIDDALLELNDVLSTQGFEIVASAAFVAQHVFSPQVAYGRPTVDDLQEAREFGVAALRKIATGQTSEVKVPGNRPYRDFSMPPAVPTVNTSDCQRCGYCASRCPTEAISPKNTLETDSQKCILCGRCVSICPAMARDFPSKMIEMTRERLAPLTKVVRKNELFL